MESWADFWAFMAERCRSCGCLLNNAPECQDECAHTEGCPPGPEFGPLPGRSLKRPGYGPFQHLFTTSSAGEAFETLHVGELGLLDPMPYRLTVNGAIVLRGTLQEVQAAVAEVATARLAAAPERLGPEVQTIRAEFSEGRVEQALAERGEWFTILDAFGPAPTRIKVTKEE